MRRFWIAVLWPTVLMAQTRAQGAPPTCTSPSCTTSSCHVPCAPPTNPQPNAGEDEGAFAAPPRTGTAVGPSRSLGIEGFGLHVPAMTLRMPTLQLPGLVCYRREPRMLIDAAEAAFTQNVTRNLAVPNSAPEPNAGNDVNNCIAPTCAPPTPPIATAPGTTYLVPIDPTVVGGQPPAPPTPKAVRAISHPDVGVTNPMNGQYMQDPTTGQIYQVVVQPAQVQLQPVAMPIQMPVQYQQVQYQTVAAPAASYPATPAPLPAVVPTAMHEPITTASQARSITQREAALMADLQATQQQAAQLEGELRRLESMVDRLAQAQAQPTVAPAPAVQPSNIPFQSVSGSVPLNGRDQESSGGATTSLMRLFKQK